MLKYHVKNTHRSGGQFDFVHSSQDWNNLTFWFISDFLFTEKQEVMSYDTSLYVSPNAASRQLRCWNFPPPFRKSAMDTTQSRTCELEENVSTHDFREQQLTIVAEARRPFVDLVSSSVRLSDSACSLPLMYWNVFPSIKTINTI